MTKIYIIDDDPNRHLQHAKLVSDLHNCGFDGVTSIDEAQAETNAKASISETSIWETTSSAQSNSVFLVDFRLVDVDEDAAYKSLMALLENCGNECLINDIKVLLETAFQTSADLEKYHSAVFACAVLRARNIPVIVISSGAFETAERLSELWDMGMAASSSSEAWKAWKVEILKRVRHPDPFVRKLLVRYHEPVSGDLNAWRHDWCQPNDGIGHGRGVLKIPSFDQDNLTGSESTENKAFHMRTDDAWSVIPAAGYLVCKSSLSHALKQFDINAQVSCDVYRFPVSPGLAFLISLKELLLACLDEQGNGAPILVELFTKGDDSTDPDISGVRIKFSDSDGHGLNLVKRLIKKIKESQNDETIPQGGLCRAVWNLGHCRSSDIQANGEPWAQMFSNGNPHWVAWPSFSKDTITFHW